MILDCTIYWQGNGYCVVFGWRIGSFVFLGHGIGLLSETEEGNFTFGNNRATKEDMTGNSKKLYLYIGK